MVDKGSIVKSFATYLTDTIEGMETVIETIDPLNKQDYTEFRVLLDYLHTILNKLQTATSVRDIMDYIDIELLYDSWDMDIFQYLSEEKNYKETNDILNKLNDEIEKVEYHEI